MILIFRIFLIFFCFNAYSLEILRDPIFENYFKNLQLKYNLPLANVYIVEQNEINAFVLGNSIYFTTGMIKNIKEEDVLKSIYFHEVGHIYHNHYNSKKININTSKKSKFYNNLFSIGAAIFTRNPNIGILTNLSIDQSILNKISTNSVNYEIQADNFMLEKISKNKINTSGLINFLNDLPESNNRFYKSHPSNKNRLILLKKYSDFKKNKNSIDFEWLKAKYGKNSNINKFNSFFDSLDKGIVNLNDAKLINNMNYINYEIFKTGIIIDDIEKMYLNLIEINSNPYLKIEFYNMVIDNNLIEYYEVIEKSKHDDEIQSEYFFYFLYGKYYNAISKKDLSNFYFCQFYKVVNIKNKSHYYCNKYDINNIPKIDNSYAIFK